MGAATWIRGFAGAALLTLVATAATACDDIERVAEQEFEPVSPGVLRVATTLPSPGFWESSGEGGFEWEIANALAERFGLELEVVEVPFERIVSGDLGGADMAIDQISITDARAEHVDFSTPYYETTSGVLSRASDDDITDVKTAREQTWCVVSGTTESDFVDDVIEPDGDVVRTRDDLECARAVADETVDAALLDLPSALVLQRRLAGLTTTARFVTDERYGIALADGSADDSANVEVVDAAIRALDADGSLRDFADRWLDAAFDRDPDDVPVIEARS